jgi:hypothetical protein
VLDHVQRRTGRRIPAHDAPLGCLWRYPTGSRSAPSSRTRPVGHQRGWPRWETSAWLRRTRSGAWTAILLCNPAPKARAGARCPRELGEVEARHRAGAKSPILPPTRAARRRRGSRSPAARGLRSPQVRRPPPESPPPRGGRRRRSGGNRRRGRRRITPRSPRGRKGSQSPRSNMERVSTQRGTSGRARASPPGVAGSDAGRILRRRPRRLHGVVE